METNAACTAPDCTACKIYRNPACRRTNRCDKQFGMRVVEGKCVFLTFSPNRRQSSMIFRMSRTRTTDTVVGRPTNVARSRKKCFNEDASTIVAAKDIADFKDLDIDDDNVEIKIPLPLLSTGRACNAQDALSSVQHYLYCAKMLLPATLQMHICMNCSHDSGDETNPSIHVKHEHRPCENVFSHNPTIMGGYAGIAHSLSISIEFQGNGTPHAHAHALISLANMYQYEDLAKLAQIQDPVFQNNGRDNQLTLHCMPEDEMQSLPTCHD